LTLLTQVGGVVWILIFGLYKLRSRREKVVKRLAAFIVVYIFVIFCIVPPIAKIFGRVNLPMSKSGILVPHTYLTILLNRNYVTPRLLTELNLAATEFNSALNLKVVYLDANFPFIDGFPLLPHLSHDDGNKIDLSFIYNFNGKPSSKKPSSTGYGVYVEPRNNEIDQTAYCKQEGNWLYDYSKYFCFGRKEDLIFNGKATRSLIMIIVNNKRVQKIFIEPHLKTRLRLSNDKVRFQGCHSVRHDDHIHLEIDRRGIVLED